MPWFNFSIASPLTDYLDSGPEPTALFSARGSLPPRARSPIKTSIGSPRKSVGGSARKSAALSSPAPRLSNGTPSRITNQEEDLSTIVDIATESLAQSIEKSPPRQPLKRPTQSPPVMKPLKAKPTAKRGRKRIFDISPDEVEDPDLTKEDLAQTSTDLLPVQEDDEPLMNGDDSMDIPPDDDRDASQQIETEVFASQQKPAGKGKRGRPKAIKESRPANTTASKTNNMDKSTTQQPDHETSPLADSTTEEAPVKRRGRPVKNNTNTSKPPVYRDDPSDPVEIGPSKPAKRAKKDTSALPPASPSTKKHPPPSARDRNAPIASTKSLWSTTKLKPGRKPKPDSISAASPMPPPPRPSAANSSSLSDRSKPKPRSLQILRSTTPADTDGARFTRSGRTTIKPIEYWRGERIVYTQPSKAEGGRVSLPGIQEIVRAEDLPEVKRARTPRRERVGKKRGRKKGNAAAWMIGEGEDVWGDEEDSEAEDWELEAGMLEGECFPWDPREERGRGSEGVMEAVGMFTLSFSPRFLGFFESWLQPSSSTSLHILRIRTFTKHIQSYRKINADLLSNAIDLAIAPRGLALLRKAVKNQTFEYAKTITLPFFHSGMVDIPPRGEKRQKNSRKNHMVFWVFAGRVIVDVSGNEFSVGRGGMWQVPRGKSCTETYTYRHHHDHLLWRSRCQKYSSCLDEDASAGIPVLVNGVA